MWEEPGVFETNLDWYCPSIIWPRLVLFGEYISNAFVQGDVHTRAQWPVGSVQRQRHGVTLG